MGNGPRLLGHTVSAESHVKSCLSMPLNGSLSFSLYRPVSISLSHSDTLVLCQIFMGGQGGDFFSLLSCSFSLCVSISFFLSLHIIFSLSFPACIYSSFGLSDPINTSVQNLIPDFSLSPAHFLSLPLFRYCLSKKY